MTDSVFEPPHGQRWFVWGMPLSGKTSLGKKLRKIVPFPVLDLDTELETFSQKSIADMFAHQGEAAFRALETHLLHAIADRHPEFVLVTGGGTPCFEDNAAFMKEQGTCLFMNTPLDELLARTTGASAKRPLLNDSPETRLRELYARRLPVYRTAHAEFFSEAEAIRFFTAYFSRSFS